MVVFLKLLKVLGKKYIEVLSIIYDEVKVRTKLISMVEDEAHILSKKKAREQN